MRILRKLFITFLIVILTLLLIATGYYLAVTKDVALSQEKLLLRDETITVYDGDGERIVGVFSPSLHATVQIENVPQHTKQAFVCTEDKRFYSHNGFDVKRIVRAAFNNLKARSFKEGASTISQQLIKNTHLSQEKTLKRKLQEWKLTRALEKRYDKDEILEKYLNVIYFGHNCFGLRYAAEFYFNKQPHELDLADSAILAGLVKSPNNYSPFKNPQACLKRKETVLSFMLKNGKITQKQKDEAIQKPLPEAPTVRSKNLGYTHFVFDELSAIAQAHDLTVGGQIEIDTYLDKSLQNELESLTNSYAENDFTAQVLDVNTHGFKACVSTVGNIKRLPGSLLKPLLVYAPSIERDIISPATPLLDEKIRYGNYAPENFDGQYRGYTSARECLSKSLNIPAVRLLETLGVQNGTAFLNKLDLPVEKDDYSLALALGGMKQGYTLQSLVSAYGALANGGAYTPCGFISQIRIDGKTVYRHKPKSTRVFSEETTYLTTDMLKTAAQTGTAKKLRSLPFAVAAKTGTVGTDNGNTDAYALSYTTRDCIGVWLGNKDNSFIPYTGGGEPCNLLMQINERLNERYQRQSQKITDFQMPTGVRQVALDKTSYYDTHTIMLADERSPIEYRFNELFKTSAIPTKKCDFFSNPSINCPILQYTDGHVVITFDKNSPTFYEYKIERHDYATHRTLYQGAFLEKYTDETIETGKHYVYTVTPIFKGVNGKSIVLPTVSTKAGEKPPSPQDGEMLQKNWWEY